MSETELLAHERISPQQPFRAFPSELSEHLRPFLDDISDDVVRAISRGIPEYSRPGDDTYTRTLRTGVEKALSLFLDRLAQPGGGWESIVSTYHGIGRGEAGEGRSLDAFQGALRLGARVAWRRINELADARVLPRPALAVLGEAMLVHLDEIVAATTAGYTDARLHAAGELQRRRRRLLNLLITDPPASPEAISDLAHAAQWPLPRRIAVVALGRALRPDEVWPIVAPEFLIRGDGRHPCIVIPDPDGPGRGRAIDLALRGRRAAVGPAVTLTGGARSLRWAVEALELARRGILPEEGIVRCADHLSTMLLFRDENLVDALADRHLAPFEEIRTPHRERLAETLLCWLQCGRNANEVATRLGIHPQTVRYRLRQLDELFGDRLHDPDIQFELSLVLRARSLKQHAAASAPQAVSG